MVTTGILTVNIRYIILPSMFRSQSVSGCLVKLLPACPPMPHVPRERILHSVNGITSAPVCLCLSVARFNISVNDTRNRNKKKSQPAVIDPQIL
jgi:hypothetical protein